MGKTAAVEGIVSDRSPTLDPARHTISHASKEPDGKLETRYRYANTLGWNTLPVPVLIEWNKADLTLCAEDILLAREAHFPATSAELYDPEKMPADRRAAHERNDETLERIHLGRRYKNDTERLEKLFDLSTGMTASAPAAKMAKPAQ